MIIAKEPTRDLQSVMDNGAKVRRSSRRSLPGSAGGRALRAAQLELDAMLDERGGRVASAGPCGHAGARLRETANVRNRCRARRRSARVT